MILIASADSELRRSWARGLGRGHAIHELADRIMLDQALAESKPSVLLLDRALPRLGSLTNVSALRLLSPATNIILLSSTPKDYEAIQVIKLGARGYCHSDIASQLLSRAVKLVQEGEIWIARKLIPTLVEEITSVHANSFNNSAAFNWHALETLTPRQMEISRLVGEGLCNKNIAQKLKITESTVKAHLTAIFRKLQIQDRLSLGLLMAEAVRNK